MANKEGSDESIDTGYDYTSENNQLSVENKVLKETISQLKNELDSLKSPPLMICEVKEVSKDKAVIRVPNGNSFLVNASQDVGKLQAGEQVLVEQRNLNIIKKHESESKKFDVEKFVIVEKPKMGWKSVGGLDDQIQEVKEVVEAPLLKPDMFKRVGIQPPKGVLLHGPPGNGKTLLAKAVAASTNSTFFEIVGSELVQKFIGEGSKLVKDLFQMARERAPSVIFIDELDAIAAQRVEVGTSGEREVQRTFMQLLSEIDGFDSLSNVKIIGCTNRKDILDEAVIRPGRLDRLIEVPHPNKKEIKEILKIHTRKMNKNNIDLDKVTEMLENASGAEIRAVCTEAGYFAIRDNRITVQENDFKKAVQKVKEKEEMERGHYFG